jgi:hypothetical protein
MKTKHTPGPWGFTPTATLNDAPCRWEILGAGGVIAETNDSTTDANARLISAAPDMLSALETLASRMSENADGRELYGDWIAIAEEAINKAKGGSK